jgi:dephospho-CoA kinase
MRKLIAFTAKTCAGKSSAADYLIEHHGFQRLSCIEPLRTMMETLDIPRDEKYIRVMCEAGAAIRRIDPCLLMLPLARSVYLYKRASFVVDDVRMAHEIPMLTDLGFTIYRITCPDDVRRERMFKRDGYYPTDEALRAVTETDLDGMEFPEIDGSLPMEEFLAEVERRVLPS